MDSHLTSRTRYLVLLIASLETLLSLKLRESFGELFAFPRL
jgi:hypothetical protein